MEAILSTCGGYLATAAFWLRKDTSKASNPPISRRSTALSLRLGVLHDRAVEEGHCGVEQVTDLTIHKNSIESKTILDLVEAYAKAEFDVH